MGKRNQMSSAKITIWDKIINDVPTLERRMKQYDLYKALFN